MRIRGRQPGARFSGDGRAASRAPVVQLGSFETVDIETQPGAAGDTLLATVEVTE